LFQNYSLRDSVNILRIDYARIHVQYRFLSSRG